jgi:hypothetical protein
MFTIMYQDASLSIYPMDVGFFQEPCLQGIGIMIYTPVTKWSSMNLHPIAIIGPIGKNIKDIKVTTGRKS